MTARVFGLLLAAGFVAGCASGPKFSRMSPANWPGAKQVSSAGRAVGGWVAKKTKLRRDDKKTPAVKVAERDANAAIPAERANVNLRSFFAGTNSFDGSEPTDPFLAQLTQEQQRVADTAQSGNSAASNRDAEVQSVAHSFDGPPVPDEPVGVPSQPVGNPFADLAGTNPTRKPAGESRSDSPRFAAGIDRQLAQLRDDATGGSRRSASEDGPIKDNPLRDAILGSLADMADEKFVDLPSDDEIPPIASIDPIDAAAGTINSAIEKTEAALDNSLPDWARGPVAAAVTASNSPAINPPVGDAPPVVEEPLVVERPAKPQSEEPYSPFHEMSEKKPVRVAVTEGDPSPKAVEETPPKAIEIVPHHTAGFAHTWPKTPTPSGIGAPQQVEMLSPPPEPIANVEAQVHSNPTEKRIVAADKIAKFSGMIVESDDLPSGFSNWNEEEPATTVSTNRSVSAKPTKAASREGVPARFAVNSRKFPSTTAPTDEIEQQDTFQPNNTFQPNIVQPRLLREIPNSESSVEGAAVEQVPTTLEPSLFAPERTQDPIAKSSLASVNWDPETEPGVDAEGSTFGSTAVIGLLIGLACLIGLGLIRRMQSAA